MNAEEARFLKIKRLSEEELADLHAAEDRAGDNWREVSARRLNVLDRQKGPYWPKQMSEDDRNRAIESFNMSQEVRRAFVMLEDNSKSESSARHGADWLVWKHAPNPSESQAASAMARLYKGAGA